MTVNFKRLTRLPFGKIHDVQNIYFHDNLRPLIIWENYKGEINVTFDEYGKAVFIFENPLAVQDHQLVVSSVVPEEVKILAQSESLVPLQEQELC